MVTVTTTWHAPEGKPTIYSALKAKLGREPTHAELTVDVRRILDARAERAAVRRTFKRRR